MNPDGDCCVDSVAAARAACSYRFDVPESRLKLMFTQFVLSLLLSQARCHIGVMSTPCPRQVHVLSLLRSLAGAPSCSRVCVHVHAMSMC